MAELTGRDHPADRHHDLPPALHAGRDRRARGPSPRQGLPADAPARRRTTGREEQGAVFVEAGAWLRAQWFPRAGETDWLAERATARCRRCAAASASATSRRSARSTSRAPTRRRSSTASTPTRSDAAGRQGALRPDAARGRLRHRRRHHRAARRRAIILMTTTTANAAQGDAAHRILPPVAVAGARRAARLGHRAVGAVRRRRPARRATLLRRIVDPERHLQRRLPLHGGGRASPWSAACRRGCSASPSRASSPTRSAVPAAMATRWRAR